MTRHAGILVPLFSLTSGESWGIGDIYDLAVTSRWLRASRVDLLQLLPLNEMAPRQHSPYSAISAMAIDPIFIRVSAVDEFQALGGEGALDNPSRRALREVRSAGRIEYDEVRRLKMNALRAAFESFLEREWEQEGSRGRELRQYVAEQTWWLEDYCLFRALHAEGGEKTWLEWPPELRARDSRALDAARTRLRREILFLQYLQWIAETQWRHSRRAASPVRVFGDLPFMVDRDSADVWAWQECFDLDASVGVPPDTFSEAGQNWGLPVCRWDALAADNFEWLRRRARRSADLYDGYRIDHLVGFYRTYAIPENGSDRYFTPARQDEQVVLGERIMTLFREAGAEIVGEDLGTVPDFVRRSLARLGVPGYRVLRWERQWHLEGKPFRDPAAYPPLSVATSGTHDTEPMAGWWDSLPPEEREAVGRLPTVEKLRTPSLASRPFDETIRDVLLEALYASGSRYLVLPIQDVFGWTDRINVPATIGDDNWTWRVPWAVDRLDERPEWRERQRQLRIWADKYERGFNRRGVRAADGGL